MTNPRAQIKQANQDEEFGSTVHGLAFSSLAGVACHTVTLYQSALIFVFVKCVCFPSCFEAFTGARDAFAYVIVVINANSL